MRPLLVVVGHELTQDSHQVRFVQHNEVVETLSPQGANHSLGNSVRRWRVDQTGDGVDADASGALTKVTAIDSVTIMQQMVWLVAPRCGLDHLSPDPGRRGVGRHVDVDQLAPTVGDEHQHIQRLERQRGYRQ